MARKRILKGAPKRGRLTRSQVKRAVEKVVYGKHSDKEAKQTHGVTTIKARRNPSTDL